MHLHDSGRANLPVSCGITRLGQSLAPGITRGHLGVGADVIDWPQAIARHGRIDSCFRPFVLSRSTSINPGKNRCAPGREVFGRITKGRKDENTI